MGQGISSSFLYVQIVLCLTNRIFSSLRRNPYFLILPSTYQPVLFTPSLPFTVGGFGKNTDVCAGGVTKSVYSSHMIRTCVAYIMRRRHHSEFENRHPKLLQLRQHRLEFRFVSKRQWHRCWTPVFLRYLDRTGRRRRFLHVLGDVFVILGCPWYYFAYTLHLLRLMRPPITAMRTTELQRGSVSYAVLGEGALWGSYLAETWTLCGYVEPVGIAIL
jgi:hypothetical protein